MPLLSGTGRVAIVAPVGELDLTASCALRVTLLRAGEMSANVLVDLSEVSFIDSVGLGALLAAQRRLRCNGGNLTAINPNGRVLRLLRVTGLTRLLETELAEDVGLSEQDDLQPRLPG